GGPEVLQLKTDYPVPRISEGQILVKNNISGINYIDTNFRSGLYPSPKPEVLGREAASVIVALGPGTEHHGFKVGDRVIWKNSTSYAEYSAVPAIKAVKIPDNVSDEDAVATSISGLTALALIMETYPVKKGDIILVHAAAGSVGFLMVQLLKLLGAVVIGTAGGREKVDLVKSLGADHVIDYRSEEDKDWVKAVKKITNGRGVDAVYDSVGKDTWEGSIDAVKKKGFIVWFGSSSGPIPPIPLPRITPKCIAICRPNSGLYTETHEEYQAYMNNLFELLVSDKLKVKIHKLYQLEEIQQAHKDLERRGTIGKLLLKL
ncbi:putative quinone oxidoreductase, partial [Talaromyces proteolyticus]